jgi:hypothetical protein
MKYLKIGNAVFARTDAALVETLFKPIDGKTASGLFRPRKNGVLFMRPNGEPAAFLAANPGQSKFWVTAFTGEDGRTRYMFSATDDTKAFLGIGGLGYAAESEQAARAWESLQPNQ